MTDTVDTHNCLAAWHRSVQAEIWTHSPTTKQGWIVYQSIFCTFAPLEQLTPSSRGKAGAGQRKIQAFQLTCVALPCPSCAAGRGAGVESAGRGWHGWAGPGLSPSCRHTALLPVSDGEACGMTEGTEKLNCINLSNIRFKRPRPPGHVSCRQISMCRLLVQ